MRLGLGSLKALMDCPYQSACPGPQSHESLTAVAETRVRPSQAGRLQVCKRHAGLSGITNKMHTELAISTDTKTH